MKKVITFFLLFGSFGLIAQEGNYSLMVSIENVKSKEGKILFGLFNETGEFLEEEVTSGGIQADSDSLYITFEGLKSGFYAVSVFHDENENGELDANFLGIPKEPYAFSNNAMGKFGPPDFEDCKFEIVDDHKLISISL